MHAALHSDGKYNEEQESLKRGEDYGVSGTAWLAFILNWFKKRLT